MAAGSGRKLRISKGATPIAGARTDNLSINNEPVDITDKDDLGWRTMLADVGVRSLDADVEGVLLDGTILAVAMGAGSGLLAAYTVTITGIGSFTGDWFLSSFTLGGEQADAVTFTAAIASSGEITYTPA
jgi:predicted secreted protein